MNNTENAECVAPPGAHIQTFPLTTSPCNAEDNNQQNTSLLDSKQRYLSSSNNCMTSTYLSDQTMFTVVSNINNTTQIQYDAHWRCIFFFTDDYIVTASHNDAVA